MNDLSPYASISSVPEQPPKRKRFRWWLIVSIFAIPIIAISSIVFLFRVGWTLREAQGRNAMNNELRKLHDEGFATDNDTSSQRYFQNTSDEKTLAWTSAFAECNSMPFTESASGVPMLDRNIEIDPFEDDFEISADWRAADACKRFTIEQKDLIDEVRQLAQEPKPVYFPIVFQSTETLLPEVQSTRTVAWMLRIDAQVAIHEKDADRAFQDVRTLIALSKQVDAVPFIVSKFVGISIRRMAMRALQKAIQLDLFAEKQLIELDQLLQPYCDIGDRWRVIMSDEMTTNLPVFENPGRSMRTNIRIPARGHDAVYFIGLMRRAIEIQTDDWQHLYQNAGVLEKEMLEDAKSLPKQVDLILTGLLAPAFSSIAALQINDSQLHRQARVAIATRLYSRRHNELPKSLSQLPDSVNALKPVGNLPFGYQLIDRQSVLWGFEFSKEVQQTPSMLPVVDQPNAVSLRNRELVWWFQ